MFTMLFDPTEFHVAGTLAYRHMAMSYQTVFQISVPIAFTFRNSIKMGGNLLGTQTKKKKEKSLMLFCLAKFHSTYTKSEWLCVRAG